MRVLLVHCHPRADSFSAALRDVARQPLAGHEVQERDLYAEVFDPVVSAQAHADYQDTAANQRGIEADIDQSQWAQALLLVYPTWWYGMPALLKGWFDRVAGCRLQGVPASCPAPTAPDQAFSPSAHPARHPVHGNPAACC